MSTDLAIVSELQSTVEELSSNQAGLYLPREQSDLATYSIAPLSPEAANDWFFEGLDYPQPAEEKTPEFMGRWYKGFARAPSQRKLRAEFESTVLQIQQDQAKAWAPLLQSIDTLSKLPELHREMAGLAQSTALNIQALSVQAERLETPVQSPGPQNTQAVSLSIEQAENLAMTIEALYTEHKALEDLDASCAKQLAPLLDNFAVFQVQLSALRTLTLEMYQHMLDMQRQYQNNTSGFIKVGREVDSQNEESLQGMGALTMFGEFRRMQREKWDEEKDSLTETRKKDWSRLAKLWCTLLNTAYGIQKMLQLSDVLLAALAKRGTLSHALSDSTVDMLGSLRCGELADVSLLSKELIKDQETFIQAHWTNSLKTPVQPNHYWQMYPETDDSSVRSLHMVFGTQFEGKAAEYANLPAWVSEFLGPAAIDSEAYRKAKEYWKEYGFVDSPKAGSFFQFVPSSANGVISGFIESGGFPRDSEGWKTID